MVETIIMFTLSWPSFVFAVLATFLVTFSVKFLAIALPFAFASPSWEIALDPIVVVVLVLFDMIG